MAKRPKILILGGTGEARALANALDAAGACEVVTSMAGRTAEPERPAGAMRRGGFGGAEGLAGYLQSEAVSAVVDATHPYAALISRNAALACSEAGVPRLMLLRPPWQPESGGRWTRVASPEDAAALLTSHGRRVFLAIGRQELSAFANRAGVWFLVRSIEPAGALDGLPNVLLLNARGPFALDDETALLRDHAIDCLVARNSGGTATYAKIAAARALGLPVIMLARPKPPAGETVGDVEAAVRWVADKFPSIC